MAHSVFDFADYKLFILKTIDSQDNNGRGVRRKLAEFIGCQVAYVSHVLAGDRHFSPEQIEAVSRYFALREDETEFLMLLLEKARAGTKELRAYTMKRIDQKFAEHQEVKRRYRITKEVSEADQLEYYSTWQYQAVASALTIPELRTPQALSKRLQVPQERVMSLLSFLISKGLVKDSDKGYVPTNTQIHLPHTSPLVSKLHTNWRVKTISALDRKDPESYHYSGLVTLSVEDVKSVREVMMKALADAVAIIQPSKEEKLCVLAMDFFEL